MKGKAKQLLAMLVHDRNRYSGREVSRFVWGDIGIATAPVAGKWLTDVGGTCAC